MTGGDDTVYAAKQLLTCDASRDARGDALVAEIPDGAVRVQDGRVTWVGALAELPPDAPAPRHTHPVLMPAWVECHTHAIFGGTRHADFARRNAGVTYAEILEAGGGIQSTVSATRATPTEELAETLRSRLRDFWLQGVAVVEVKTGYGLDLDEELRHLRIIRDVASTTPVHVVPTCLAAHTVPAEWRDDRAGYVAMICDELLPRVADEGLADQVDVFCDRGAFSVAESRQVLERAHDLGFALRVHAEELAHTGATQLACALGAASADHLEWINEFDVAAMAAADVAAVLLPTVTTFLDLPHRAPARSLAQAGVRLAVSTDFNPGSAHGASLQLALSLSCSLHKLTPAEALAGVTRVPAEILGVSDTFGVIRPGAAGAFVAFDVPDWRAIPYYIDHAPRVCVGPAFER